jgi:membrane-bound serine protease (ClpP class)
MLWVFVLFVAGIALVLAEFLLPGAICGAVGAVCLLASAGLAIYEAPDQAFWIIMGELLGVVMSVALGFYLFPRVGLGRRMILASELKVDEGYVSNESDESLVGQIATAFTKLRPAGTILLGDRRLGAVTSGNYIDKGVSVRIIEVHGNRIVVEPADL